MSSPTPPRGRRLEASASTRAPRPNAAQPIGRLSFIAVASAWALGLSACSGMPGGHDAPGHDGASLQAARTLATPQADGRTAEGGFVDAFQFSEKPGDVTLEPVAFAAGSAHARGTIAPGRGSTWGGIALTASLARGGRAVDVSWAHAIGLSLAAPGAATLRVRLVGRDAALRDSGCYPVALVQVTPELREYTLPVASFAPEPYCAAGAPSGLATAAALAAVELADATVVAGRRRPVDFTVGVIRALP
ncbi:MAG: hypothetical protein ACTHL8_26390 [Burkholderiaceae bacterium]